VGAAGYVMVATAAVLAVIVGALTGVLAWAMKVNLLWGGACAVAAYLATLTLLGSYSFTAATVVGGPPLILTVVTSGVTARFLDARAKLWRPVTALLALVCALLVGFLFLLLLRHALGFPFSVAR
jgi:hypothetical protein